MIPEHSPTGYCASLSDHRLAAHLRACGDDLVRRFSMNELALRYTEICARFQKARIDGSRTRKRALAECTMPDSIGDAVRRFAAGRRWAVEGKARTENQRWAKLVHVVT